MFDFIKECIRDYKEYKIEKENDRLLTEQSLAKHCAEVEKEIEERERKEEKLLKENIVYDENTGSYHFEVTADHKGKSRVFSCDASTKDSCRNIAAFVLLSAYNYELWGD